MKKLNSICSDCRSFFKQTEIIYTIGLLLILVAAGCLHQQRVQKMSFLHTQGQDIVDEQGNKVYLKGVGLGNWLLPEGYMWKFGSGGDRPRKIEKIVNDLIGEEQAAIFWKGFRQNYITKEDVQKMSELGFNSVRVALNARLFMTEDSTRQFIDEGFQHLDNLINWCKEYQLYVIIDMHGAPGGQTGANIDDSPNDLPELFMDVTHQDALVKLWVRIAQLYKDEPAVAAYDLLNEPLPQNTGAADKYRHLVEPLYERLITEIRKVDKKHMFTLEGVNWANDWEIFTKKPDNNLFLQFHYYCWSWPTNLHSIDYYLKKRDQWNVPIWVGETGEKDNTIYWGTTQYFEEKNVGWAFWPWKKMDTRNTPYSIVKPANWDAIAEYSHNGIRPEKEVAEKILNDLLTNIKLVNCEYQKEVVASIFRQVPGKIEAENYGHGAYGKDYFVRDTTSKAAVYRTWGYVPIELIETDSITQQKRNGTEQCIVLNREEWSRYSFYCLTDAEMQLRVKLFASEVPANIQLMCGEHEFEETLTKTGWDTLTVSGLLLNEGQNSMTIKSMDASVKVDWILIE
ncbi:MAG TPA: glycoside hydrolase [Marinilabiliales bacterium]|nr:glycoside hydrolase [Marinilabiliales bacterium]